MCAAFGGQGDDGEQRSQKAALRALWKIRASASGGSTALRAEPASVDREDDTEEPKSLLPASAYDDLPPLPNAIGQQQSRDYAGGEEQYTFEGPKRAGTVTILGAPNAGKSTLLNYLVGSKIAIVTHKRQTTRQAITGIAMEGGTQVVYIDTPGIMAPRPKERLNKAMVKSAWNSARDADQIFFIVDADKIIPGGMGPGRTGRKIEPLVHPVAPERLRFKKGSNEELIMNRLQERNQRYNLILNKVDQLRDDRKTLLLPLAEEIRRCAGANTEGLSMISKVFAVSASHGKGLESIRTFLRESLPQGEWLYPIDQISNVPVRNIMAEFTREAIFLRAHEEVPYSSYVETETYKQQPDGAVRIEQTIYVETEGQKKILVGMIKDLGTKARSEMKKFLGCNVHLFLKIKSSKGWTESNSNMYQRLGLDFDA